VNLPSILLWGAIGTLTLTALMSAGQALGYSRLHVPLLLGTLFTGQRDRALVLAFFTHLAMGWIFALVYALVFESWRRATWWLGALSGAAHGFFVLAALIPMLPSLHPRMATETHGPSATRSLQPPGFMGLHYGRRTPWVVIGAHLLYGAILGAFYRVKD